MLNLLGLLVVCQRLKLLFLLIPLELLDISLVLLLLPLCSLLCLLLPELFGFLLQFLVFLLESSKHLLGVVFIGLLVLLDFLEIGLEGFSLFLLLLFLFGLNLFNFLFIFLQLELHLLLMFLLSLCLIVKYSQQHIPVILLVSKFLVQL